MALTKLNPHAARTTLIVLSVAVLVAACASSTSSSSTSAAASGSSTASRPAIAACLRKHGINFPAGRRPDGGTPPSGTPGAGSATPPAGAPPAGAPPSGFPGGAAGGSKFRAALKACGANLPAGRRPAQFSRQRIQKYVTCVHQHGYDLPNPNLSGNGPVFPSKIRSNAKFQAASKACQSLLAPPQPGGGSSST